MVMRELLIVIIVIIVITVEDTNVCVWNAINSPFMNGLWTSVDQSLSIHPYYTLNVDPSCEDIDDGVEYLYLSEDNHWTISPVLDSTDIHDFRGICHNERTVSLDKCEGNWHIPYDTLQKSVTVSMRDSCPEVQCEYLNVDFGKYLERQRCAGQYQRVGTNRYKKGVFDDYLYFNPAIFRWVCGPKTDLPNNKCPPELNTYYSYSNDKSWHNAHNLKKTPNHIEIPWNNGRVATFSCIDKPFPEKELPNPLLLISVSAVFVMGFYIIYSGVCCTELSTKSGDADEFPLKQWSAQNERSYDMSERRYLSKDDNADDGDLDTDPEDLEEFNQKL